MKRKVKVTETRTFTVDFDGRTWRGRHDDVLAHLGVLRAQPNSYYWSVGTEGIATGTTISHEYVAQWTPENVECQRCNGTNRTSCDWPVKCWEHASWSCAPCDHTTPENVDGLA